MTRLATRPTVLVAGLLTAALGAGPAFAATPAATTLTLKAAKTTVAHNSKTTLTGALRSGGKAVAGQSVKLERRASGTKSFTVLSTKKTDAKGAVSYSVIPGTKKGQKTQYELVFAGSSKYKGSHSTVVTITVS